MERSGKKKKEEDIQKRIFEKFAKIERSGKKREEDIQKRIFKKFAKKKERKIFKKEYLKNLQKWKEKRE